MLDRVGIPDAARRITEYPFQLSGGMKQRVMIAMALAGQPRLLVADEPTTALDVTIQAQVLQLLRDTQAASGMSLLLITHDLGVVAEMAHQVGVMYAGQIVEQASREQLFRQPLHPYTQKLFAAMPDASRRSQTLAAIPGSVPQPGSITRGCRFAPRCDKAWSLCHEQTPEWTGMEDGQGVRCHLYSELVASSLLPVTKGENQATKSEQEGVGYQLPATRLPAPASQRLASPLPDPQGHLAACGRAGEGGGWGVAGNTAGTHAGAGRGIGLRQDHAGQGVAAIDTAHCGQRAV